jgi:hypothetical protein
MDVEGWVVGWLSLCVVAYCGIRKEREGWGECGLAVADLAVNMWVGIPHFEIAVHAIWASFV